MTIPFLFLEQPLAHGLLLSLSGESFHYLANVLRIRVGEQVRVASQGGGNALARVVGLDETRVTLEVVQMSAEAAGPLFDLAIIAPGLKQRGTETLAALCGELGIRRLFLTNLRRSVARVSAGKVARLTAVATEAARRVGQPSIPAIEVAATLEAAVAAVAGRPLYFLWEKGGLDVAELRLPEGGRAAFVLGTEGGFDPSETETLIRWGAIPLHLRGTAYTAVTAAAAGMILFLHKGGAL